MEHSPAYCAVRIFHNTDGSVDFHFLQKMENDPVLYKAKPLRLEWAPYVNNSPITDPATLTLLNVREFHDTYPTPQQQPPTRG